ncbi:unnamed protein product [Victoria cruziana]
MALVSSAALAMTPLPVLLLNLLLFISPVIVYGDRRTALLRSTAISRTAEMDGGAANSPPSPAGLCSKVRDYGYPCEEHKVTTADGYILALNRITKAGQPVLLQHDVLVDGMTWLLNGMNQSLALVLADGGYDVWIANSRGTRWSRGHVSLNPSQREYWDELAKFDLPSATSVLIQGKNRIMLVIPLVR